MPTHVPLEALYLLVIGLIVPPKENVVAQLQFCTFFVMSSTPEVVKTHLSRGHQPQGTIDTLEDYLYHKPSLILMRFIKM